MKRQLAAGAVAVALLFCLLSGCAKNTAADSVVLRVLSPSGEPQADIHVHAEKYPDGREIFPGPEFGVTDENGEMTYVPEKFGEQKLTFVYYASEGPQWEIQTVTVTKEDAREHATVPVTLTFDSNTVK